MANRCHQFLYFFLIPPGLAVTTGEAISSQFYGSVSLSGSDPRLVSCEWVPMSLVMNISYGHSCWVIQDLVPTSCYGMLCIARSTILNWSFTWASLQSYLWRLRRILQLPLGATQSRVQHNLSSFKHPRYLPDVCWSFRYLLSLGNLKWFEKEKTEWVLIKDLKKKKKKEKKRLPIDLAQWALGLEKHAFGGIGLQDSVLTAYGLWCSLRRGLPEKYLRPVKAGIWTWWSL